MDEERVMAANRGLLAADKRYLAGVIHQVWRACQGFVSVVMERGPEDAFFVLDELDERAAAQSAASDVYKRQLRGCPHRGCGWRGSCWTT